MNSVHCPAIFPYWKSLQAIIPLVCIYQNQLPLSLVVSGSFLLSVPYPGVLVLHSFTFCWFQLCMLYSTVFTLWPALKYSYQHLYKVSQEDPISTRLWTCALASYQWYYHHTNVNKAILQSNIDIPAQLPEEDWCRPRIDSNNHYHKIKIRTNQK